MYKEVFYTILFLFLPDMKFSYRMNELPQNYQNRFKEGINLHNPDFYTSPLRLKTMLFFAVVVGFPCLIPPIIFITQGDKIISQSITFFNLILLIIIILFVVVIGIWLWLKFLLEYKIYSGKKKGVGFYGLLLTKKELIYRPKSLKNKAFFLKKEFIQKAERIRIGSDSGVYKAVRIFYHIPERKVIHQVDLPEYGFQHHKKLAYDEVIESWLKK